MSLRVSGQLTTLADAIYELVKTPIVAEGQTAAQMEAAAKLRLKNQLDKVCEYLISYMEIKGITVGESYVAGTGSHGGALNAATYPVVGSVAGHQTNDGTGRIA